MSVVRKCTALFLLVAFEAFAQGPSPLYVVTYVEVKPPAKPEARPGQFVLLTAWKDQKAYEAHAAAASTREFRDRLQGLRNSPADDRFHNALSVGDLDGARPARGVYVVTHVDVIPPRKDDAVGLLKSLGEASRRDDGNLRYEIVQQTNRPNHFTVVEIWASREALDAHGMAPHVREFRDKLAPMSGALYDERLYETVN
jgi:quinol monooxygenase YgiN